MRKRKDKARGQLGRVAFRALMFLAAGCALVALLGAAGYYALYPRICDEVVLKQVQIKGNRFTTGAEIMSAIAPKPGTPMLQINAEDARKKLQEIPFVSGARVTRVVKSFGAMFDGTLLVEITGERLPVAKAILFGRKNWLLDDGTLLKTRPGDDGDRFDAARRMPVVRFYSTRQTGSPELVRGVLSVLGAIARNAPGLIKEITVSQDSSVTLVENGGIPIKLSTLESPQISLANLSDVLRLISGNRQDYVEVVLSPSGESHLLLKPEAGDNSKDKVKV